jgi:hypothetical protein
MVLKIECFADDPTGCVGRPSCKQDLVDLFYAPMWIFLLEIREQNLLFGMRSHARRMKLRTYNSGVISNGIYLTTCGNFLVIL